MLRQEATGHRCPLANGQPKPGLGPTLVCTPRGFPICTVPTGKDIERMIDHCGLANASVLGGTLWGSPLMRWQSSLPGSHAELHARTFKISAVAADWLGHGVSNPCNGSSRQIFVHLHQFQRSVLQFEWPETWGADVRGTYFKCV